MSFNQAESGKTYAPGWFLKNAECVRETQTIAQNHAQVVTSNGVKHVPMGAFWPANDSSTVKGIVYEDVDVTTGAMPGSVVTKGEVYLDRLPASPESGVQSALEGLGFKFVASAPAVARPASGNTLASLTVTSTAGASGKSAIATSGYVLGAGESYVYKTDASTAPAVALGDILATGWTALSGGAGTITATDGHKITVAVINAGKAAVAAGDATIASGT